MNIGREIDNQRSRRQFLTGVCGAGVSAVLLAGCGKTNSVACATGAQLTRSQKAARDARQYVEASREAGKDCSNCVFFEVGDGACGKCGIDALPAHPAGYCSSWAKSDTANRKMQGARNA